MSAIRLTTDRQKTRYVPVDDPMTIRIAYNIILRIHS